MEMSDYEKYMSMPKQKGYKRDGSLNLGDEPLYFRNRIVIGNDVFWQIKWKPSKNSAVKYILYDSFESEESLLRWNAEKFTELSQQIINRLSDDCSD